MTDNATRRAVLVDFGGVLTTSLFDAFRDFGASIGSEPDLPLEVLATDPEAAGLLAAHEEGRIDDEEFEVGFAARLAARGATTDPQGLITRLQSGMKRDWAMLALVRDLRNQGYLVALVSNSLGRDCYAGFDLDGMFDEQVISSAVGIRKPSRRIYEVACERLGVAPTEAVMIDDLAHNLEGAARLGIAGVLHTDAETTRTALKDLLMPSAKLSSRS